MRKPMTGERFSNIVALFTGGMIVFTSAVIVSVTVFDANPWVMGAIQATGMMFAGSRFSTWLYWETTQTAFDAIRETEKGLSED